MGNYHYYLKQELYTPRPESKRFSAVHWHPEQALTLYLSSGGQSAHEKAEMLLIPTSQAKCPFTSSRGRQSLAGWICRRTPEPWRSSTEVGFACRLKHEADAHAAWSPAQLLMTPFRTQNVPPPMSSYTIRLAQTPVHIAFSITKDELAVLFGDGAYAIWKLQTATKKLRGPRGLPKAAEPIVLREGRIAASDLAEARQICFDTADVAILGTSKTGGKDVVWRYGAVHSAPSRIGRLLQAGDSLALGIAEDGAVLLGELT